MSINFIRVIQDPISGQFELPFRTKEVSGCIIDFLGCFFYKISPHKNRWAVVGDP